MAAGTHKYLPTGVVYVPQHASLRTTSNHQEHPGTFASNKVITVMGVDACWLEATNENDGVLVVTTAALGPVMI